MPEIRFPNSNWVITQQQWIHEGKVNSAVTIKYHDIKRSALNFFVRFGFSEEITTIPKYFKILTKYYYKN